MTTDLLIRGDVLVTVLTHAYGDLEPHRGVGGVEIGTLTAQGATAATTVVLERKRQGGGYVVTIPV